jgi:hypothetical protein
VVFYATFNNISAISWWSVLFMEETGGPGENHRPVATHLQTLSHDVVSSAPRHAKSEIRTRNVIGDRSAKDHDHHFARIKLIQVVLFIDYGYYENQCT